jgi:polyhydroxyalkanoate synthesis regulator phasin
MAKNSLKWLALLGGLAVGSASLAVAQDSGPLIDTLVKKGILTDQEGEDLRVELLKDFGTTAPGKLDISSSVTKLRIAGDVRVRYQYDNEVANNAVDKDNDRNRYRYRFRFAFTADLGPKWTAGLRLETADSATSTNADFGNNGSTNFAKTGDTAFIGQVYIQYKDQDIFGADKLTASIGKHAHPFFNPGVNGFWIDSDINFEGVSEELVYSVGSDYTTSIRAGQYLLASNARGQGVVVGSNNGPSMMFIAQAEFAKGKKWRVAPTLVAFDNSTTISGANFAVVSNSDANNYKDLFTVLVPFEYNTKMLGQPTSFYATYGYNFSGEDRYKRMYGSPTTPVTAGGADFSQMFNLGVKYGAGKLAGEYTVTAEYRYIEPGAYTSILLDSDFNAGRLGGQGPILSFAYNFTDAVTTTVTYFSSFNIDSRSPGANFTGTPNSFGRADVLQIDLSAKF